MSASTLTAEIVTDLQDANAFVDEWDRLAAELGRPYAAPAWMLSWWRNAAPTDAALRLVVVREGSALVGIGPFCATDAGRQGATYRMLGVGNRLEPLAVTGAEERTARAIAEAIAGAEPRPARISLLAAPSGSVWARAIADSWPAQRRAVVAVDRIDVAPALELEGSFDEWFARRSSNFRSQMRRAERQLEALGGRLRQAEPAELDHALSAFARLHHARWEGRGGSGLLNTGIEGMLREAGTQLSHDRFRLWLIDLDGEIVNAHLFVAAGGAVSYWLGGFDERIAAQRPALITILAAIEQAFASGDRRIDLGAGGQDYKYRFAADEDRLEWVSVVPPGRGSLRVRRKIAAARLRRGLADRLPERHRARVRNVLRMVRRP